MKEFLRALMAHESGIRPERHDWYVQNLDRKVVRFPLVEGPGRLRRNPLTGLHECGDLTIAEYFDALGVFPYFEPGNRDSLRSMQYRSMNPWGYIGYQVGEALLIETGYYTPKSRRVVVEGEVKDLPSFYCGSVPETQWAGRKSEHVFQSPESGGWMVGTDVNRWQGTFTGKGDVFQLNDLFDPGKQDRMMVDILRFNHRKLVALLRASGKTIEQCFPMSWGASIEGRSCRVRCTLSGLLACCHLNGVAATVELLMSSVVHRDHLGTPSLAYMQEFGGYPMHDALR